MAERSRGVTRKGRSLVSSRHPTMHLSKLRVAAPTLRRWCRATHFPEPLQLGPNCLRWVRADVEAWLASRRRVAAVIEPVAADRHCGRQPHTAASSSVNRL